MKVEFVSDLHLEAYRTDYVNKHGYKQYSEFTKDKDTVLVLAGDIDSIKLAIEFAVDMCNQYKHVILVPGNHEYWKYAINKDYLPANTPSNFSLFDDGSKFIVIDNVLFTGATLWTDFNKADPLCLYDAQNAMADYKFTRVYPHYSKLTPNDVLWLHQKHKANLEKVYENNDTLKTVCVTHHSPSLKSDLRGGDKYSYFYHCTDMDSLISKTDLWVHGHTHDNVDYTLLGCRIVSNCFGYPVEYGKKGNDFKSGWVIEL